MSLLILPSLLLFLSFCSKSFFTPALQAFLFYFHSNDNPESRS